MNIELEAAALDLYTKKEELHPDLAPYVRHDNRLGDLIQHPLFYQVFHHSSLNAYANACYLSKKKYAEDAYSNKNFSKYIWLHERPYRLEKLIEIESELNDIDFWSIFGSVWMDSENLWQYKKDIKNIFKKNRPGVENMMDDEEKKFLESLPSTVIAYRGHQLLNKSGYSWTLSYWKAKWFANRFDNPENGVIKAEVEKENIIAVLLGRGEFELIVKPECVKKQNIVSPKSKSIKSVINDCKLQFNSKEFSVHNSWHWEKVEINAKRLCDLTPDADWNVCQLFAYIHDSQRENDYDDPKHGLRAADYARNLFKQSKLDITNQQLELLCEACEHHNDGQVSNNPTIGVCWDSDRLDLSRVGIIPDPKLLSVQVSKDLIWRV